MDKNNKEKRKFYQKKRFMIPISISCSLIFLSVFSALLSILFLTTNNAFVYEYSIPINSKNEGKIIKLNIQNNSSVKTGEIIAQIDETKYIEKVNEKQKELEEAQKEFISFEQDFINLNLEIQEDQKTMQKAKINLENANNDYVMYKISYKDGTVTQKDLDNAVKNLETAQIQYEAQQNKCKKTNNKLSVIASKKDLHNEKLNEAIEELREAKFALSNTTIIAPKNGTIINLNIKDGDKIDEEQKIADIILDECFIMANFNKIHFQDLKLNQKANVKIYTLGFKTFEGEVVEIMPEKSNLIPVKIKISNNSKKCILKKGAKAFVKIKKTK